MRKGQWLIIGALLVLLAISTILIVPKAEPHASERVMSAPLKELMINYLDAQLSSINSLSMEEIEEKFVEIHDTVHMFYVERGLKESTFLYALVQNDTDHYIYLFNGAHYPVSFSVKTSTNIYPPRLVNPLSTEVVVMRYETVPHNLTVEIYTTNLTLCFSTSILTGFSAGGVAIVKSNLGNVMVMRTSNLRIC